MSSPRCYSAAHSRSAAAVEPLELFLQYPLCIVQLKHCRVCLDRVSHPKQAVLVFDIGQCLQMTNKQKMVTNQLEGKNHLTVQVFLRTDVAGALLQAVQRLVHCTAARLSGSGRVQRVQVPFELRRLDAHPSDAASVQCFNAVICQVLGAMDADNREDKNGQ